MALWRTVSSVPPPAPQTITSPVTQPYSKCLLDPTLPYDQISPRTRALQRSSCLQLLLQLMCLASTSSSFSSSFFHEFCSLTPRPLPANPLWREGSITQSPLPSPLQLRHQGSSKLSPPRYNARPCQDPWEHLTFYVYFSA